jgi:hypothetical protein
VEFEQRTVSFDGVGKVGKALPCAALCAVRCALATRNAQHAALQYTSGHATPIVVERRAAPLAAQQSTLQSF